MNKREISEIRHRFALLIGVRDYDKNDWAYPPLVNTVNDVVELEKILTRFGYTVRMLHCGLEGYATPTRENIWGELKNMCSQTGPGDLLLVYFAGHGVLHNNNSVYLLPANGRRAALQETAIELDAFKREITGSGAQAKILFLDACHSGMARSSGGMSPDFERRVFLEATGMAILSSCRQSEVSYEHDVTPHGVFSFYLLEGLKGAAPHKSQRFITFDEVKDYVTHQVRNWAIKKGLQQWPNADTWLRGNPALVELPPPSSSQLPNGHDLNPFTTTLAIREADRFIGRKVEIHRLLTLLQRSSVAVEGEPKIGKSSLLWHLARIWKGRVINPINCMNLENDDDFFQQIAEALELDRFDWRSIRRALNNQSILLLIDELDVAPEKKLHQSQLNRFRPICENNPGFKIVAVSRRPLREVFPDPGWGSPFYNLLQPLLLGPLPEEEARLVLNHPWSPDSKHFEPAICEKLLDISGRHPFKLQKAAFHCYEAMIDPTYDWESVFLQDMEHLL